MQTGSSEALIGWKSGKTACVSLWDRVEGAWLWTLLFMTNVSAKKHSHKLDKDDLMKILCAAVRCRMTDPGFWRQNCKYRAFILATSPPDQTSLWYTPAELNSVSATLSSRVNTQTRPQKHLLSVQQPVAEETTESRVFFLTAKESQGSHFCFLLFKTPS